MTKKGELYQHRDWICDPAVCGNAAIARASIVVGTAHSIEWGTAMRTMTIYLCPHCLSDMIEDEPGLQYEYLPIEAEHIVVAGRHMIV